MIVIPVISPMISKNMYGRDRNTIIFALANGHYAAIGLGDADFRIGSIHLP